MHEALFYQKLKKQQTRCNVCHHHCLIHPDQLGICGARKNSHGTLYATNYGLAIAAAVDPIEKKPLLHFLPGTQTFSFATTGCNFKCLHCQNADISQTTINPKTSSQHLAPSQIIKLAQQYNCPSISYTYTEPTIFLEYALDTMKLAHQHNLKNIWVSNGYMSQETLNLITPYLDAINIDLKAFTEKFYHKVCSARLEPVLNNLIEIHQNKIHLEITTLIIQGYNDSETELENIAKFIHDRLSPNIPWHVTAFYPSNKLLNISQTPVNRIKSAQQIGKNLGLKYVYPGNI